MRNNILSDSFIYTGTPISGALKTLNAEEISKLIAASGNVVTFSGSEVALKIDLGFQRSIESLEYNFSPVSTSGLVIKYGRDLETLVTGALITTGSGIRVTPSISGYTCPRYFLINQYTISGTPRTLNSLSVINTEEEINFGDTGTVDSITVTAGNSFGYSQIQELKVYNNGNNTADIFVSIDPTNIDLDIFNRLELSNTPTGIFSSTYSGFNMPTEVPWEWGMFSGTGISSTNQLELDNYNINYKNFIIDSRVEVDTYDYPDQNNAISISISGVHYVAVMGVNNRLRLIDPIRDVKTMCSYPTITPSDDTCTGIVWDGGDRIYYLQNDVSRNVHYYKISTNTHHILTTVNFYVRKYRMLVIYNNELYIAGAQTTAGTDTSVGSDFYKINLSTLIVTKLTSLPSVPNSINLCVLGDYIYYGTQYTGSSGSFYRYDANFNIWQTLSTSIVGLSYFSGYITPSIKLNCILFGNRFGSPTLTTNIYMFNPISLTWSANPLITNICGILGYSDYIGFQLCLCANESLIYFNQEFSEGNYRSFAYVLSEVPTPILAGQVSGLWLSPIFKLDQNDNKYYNLLLDYDKDSGSNIKADNSLNVDNFEIRGSDLNPSCDSSIEDFIDLDPTVFLTNSLNGVSDIIVASNNILIFSHDYIDADSTLYNSSYLTYGYPFNTTGRMQYKFWWNPASNKVAGNTNYSKFYLVPFLDTLNTGKQAERNIDTLDRSENNNIYLRFGQASDTGGTFSILAFYNGSTTTTYGISATTGKFYEINLIIDWDAGTYSLYFSTILLGSGIIPQVRIALLKPQHTYEIFSSGQSIDFEEKFKKLTINRIGTVVEESLVNITIPVHREDPYYGINGTLPWYPVTINSALIPKQKYMQFKLTLRTSTYMSYPIINAINFPTVVVCSGVPASGTGSVYMRYNFPPSNNKYTDILKIKAWMKTDKE